MPFFDRRVFGYDQFALSWQVERLSAGVRVSKSRRTRADLVRALERATQDRSIREGAARLAARLRDEADGASVAAELILGLGATTPPSRSAQGQPLAAPGVGVACTMNDVASSSLVSS